MQYIAYTPEYKCTVHNRNTNFKMATSAEVHTMVEAFIDGELQGYSVNEIKITFSESKKKCKDKDFGLFIPKMCLQCNNVIMFHGANCAAVVMTERDQRLLSRLITKETRLQEEIQSILMEHDTVEVNSANPPPHTPAGVFQAGASDTHQSLLPARTGKMGLNGRITKHSSNIGIWQIHRIPPILNILHSGLPSK